MSCRHKCRVWLRRGIKGRWLQMTHFERRRILTLSASCIHLLNKNVMLLWKQRLRVLRVLLMKCYLKMELIRFILRWESLIGLKTPSTVDNEISRIGLLLYISILWFLKVAKVLHSQFDWTQPGVSRPTIAWEKSCDGRHTTLILQNLSIPRWIHQESILTKWFVQLMRNWKIINWLVFQFSVAAWWVFLIIQHFVCGKTSKITGRRCVIKVLLWSTSCTRLGKSMLILQWYQIRVLSPTYR